ncbi:MAG: class I SAM-dependent methyltransferase [Phycisphaeraceae bacterium]|nr:class I SAM-dependent methyltransferase [Phycisphaeraceae bacterium]
MPQEPSYLAPYAAAIRASGAGFQATLWRSREGQRRRFEVFTDFVDFGGATILDIGCGPGDFAAYLLEAGVAYRSFFGVDALPEMVAAATARRLDRASFHAGDPVADPDALDGFAPDWVTCSGALNTLDEPVAVALLDRLFARGAQGLIFNFLSDRPHPQGTAGPPAPARRFSTIRLLDHALARTCRVAFRQDYLDGHDATIAMWHDGRG